MKIEVLFPEICNLFGDLMNVEYLSRCIPDAEIVRTSLKSEPEFVSGGVDMIFMGAMSERSQEIVVRTLRPYKERILELIDGGTVFLATGNAAEVFGTRIEGDDGVAFDGLGIFDFVAKREMMNRYNSLYLGKFGDIDIVGFKSQFSHSYGADGLPGLFETVRGCGRNRGVSVEGIRKNNFMATYVIGPLLVVNPPFTKYIMKLLGVEEPRLAYEEEAMDSYNLRLKEFSDPKTGFDY